MWAATLGPLGLGGCGGPQSALAPAGWAAERIAELFWWMAGAGLLVWLAMMALAVHAIRARPAPRSARQEAWWIIGGGAAVPALLLAVLLVYGLRLLPQLLAPAPPGSLQIAVTGEQFWWRIRYRPPGRPEVELANEIRLPAGQPVEFRLDSADVIHSFWIPALGGKVDLIPGRQTRLSLLPTRAAVLRGVCAEFCGTAHARMAFPVVVLEPGEFAAWLDRQTGPARPVADALAARGQELFLAAGCGACHRVRGTPADGRVGPDLTHVGARLSLGAGTLASRRIDFRRWIGATTAVKPGAHMPGFGALAGDELEAIAAYLEGLK